jgi:hypothetical protein
MGNFPAREGLYCVDFVVAYVLESGETIVGGEGERHPSCEKVNHDRRWMFLSDDGLTCEYPYMAPLTVRSVVNRGEDVAS